MAIVMDPRNPATPGVYIQELNAFPNSVVEVATAIPAFIGYTQRASNNGQSLLQQAIKITSLNDYITYFGTGPASVYINGKNGPASTLQFSISSIKPTVAGNPPLPSIPAPPAGAVDVSLNNSLIHTLMLNTAAAPAAAPYYLSLCTAGNFNLYNSIRLFYQNGGETCYIISIGTPGYQTPPAEADFDAGLATLSNYPDPTLIVFPDALLLSGTAYAALMESTLTFVQGQQNLFALFDVWGAGYADSTPQILDALQSNFRTGTGINALNCGAAYFPWLQTGVMQAGEITFLNFPDLATYMDNATAISVINNVVPQAQAALKSDLSLQNPATQAAINAAHNALMAASTNYKNIIDTATAIANVLPATPAIAGIYTMVDNISGVWKAPANVSLTNVVAPVVNLSDDLQTGLNIDAATGKSINAIRAFTGQGILVWGARTLDGNSQDWRYVNVRRTMLMIEQSVKLAARAYVFEPNTANTWATIKSMLNDFLTDLWKKGALAGAKAEDAFSVSVGLGSTMTGDDILNGIMNITVLVAISHPAQFIVITFQQQMQKS